jgi:hypothetical protein
LTYFNPATGFNGQGVELVVDPSGSCGASCGGELTAVALPRTAARAGVDTSGNAVVGQSTWYRVKIRFPAGKFFATYGEWNWLFEWHNDPHTASYAGAVSPVVGVSAPDSSNLNKLQFHLRPAGGDSTRPLYQHYYTPAGSVQFDHWYDLIVHIVWDTKALGAGGTGSIECWLDGQPFPAPGWANPHPFPTLMHNPDGTHSTHTHGLYNYRKHDALHTSRVDFDDWYVGPSAPSVGFTS